MGSEGGCEKDSQNSLTESGEEMEWKKVNFMRVFVEGQDPLAKEVDNYTIRRFLKARDLNIEKASAMFLKYLKWKREQIPNSLISEDEVKNEIAQKKMFMQGFDKKGHPIGLLMGSKHRCTNRDEFKRFVVYVLEKLCSSIPSGKEKFICIADLQGWGLSNCDIRSYLAALDIMQDYYPERLEKIFLIHVPYLFMKAWKVVCPFIDKNTREKYVFVEDKKIKSTLLEDIEEQQLPEIYGGKLPLVPINESKKLAVNEVMFNKCHN